MFARLPAFYILCSPPSETLDLLLCWGGEGGGLVGFEGGHDQKHSFNVKTFVLGPPSIEKK